MQIVKVKSIMTALELFLGRNLTKKPISAGNTTHTMQEHFPFRPKGAMFEAQDSSAFGEVDCLDVNTLIGHRKIVKENPFTMVFFSLFCENFLDTLDKLKDN